MSIRKAPLRTALALALIALCSCSRVKLAYNMADWLMERQAHKYLLLGPAADEALGDEIKAYHAWHRKEMLPKYASLCRRMAKGFRGQEDMDSNLNAVLPMMTRLWLDTVEPMVAPVAGALASLDQQGIARLERAYAEDAVKQRKNYLENPQAALDHRADKTLDYVKQFAGPLQPKQEEAIRSLARGLRVPNQAWIEDREARKRALITLLKQHRGTAEIKALLRNWWLRSRMSHEKDPASLDDDESKRFFKGILGILTPAQREQAALEMDQYAVDFEELAREVPGPQPRPAPLVPNQP